ncbi:MAG: hypothetical protein ACRDZQ_12970 [Acidimicrobiales bacterium]
MSYRLEAGSAIEEWAERDRPRDELRRRVLAWLMDLAENPEAVSSRDWEYRGLPVRSALVPGTYVSVRYVVLADQALVWVAQIKTIPFM